MTQPVKPFSRIWILPPALAFCVLIGLVGLISAGAWAETATPQAVLAQAHYDYVVAEYCGLVDQPVAIGYFLLKHDLLARGNVNSDDNRVLRQQARAAADLEYMDRGLSGQKNWCRTEGKVAVDRFTIYFQRRRLPDE